MKSHTRHLERVSRLISFDLLNSGDLTVDALDESV
jgi:hypothetical protein